MIRVTLEDGKILEYEIATYLNKAIYVTTKRKMYFVGFPLENVVKIEKKVKDLTLEECKKLGMQVDMFANYYDLKGIVLDFDDYIDIIDIVKGSVKDK